MFYVNYIHASVRTKYAVLCRYKLFARNFGTDDLLMLASFVEEKNVD